MPRFEGFDVLAIASLFLVAGVVRAQAQAGGVCEATGYGLSTSAADNTAALGAALQACQGRTVHIAAGNYRFAPGQFAHGLTIPASTSLVGDGAPLSTLTVAGPGNFDSLFWIVDASNVAIRGLTLVGNGTAYQPGSCTYDYGRAISVYAVQPGGAPVTNISIASNVLSNFVGSAWISVYGAAGSGGVGTVPAGADISIEGNFFQSMPGDSAAPDNPNCNSSGVQLYGGGTIPNVTNVSISANGFDTSYLKQGIVVYGSSSQVTISANSISGTGQKLPQDRDSTLYGVIIYQKQLSPNTINVLGNRILNAYSCGVYVAGGHNISIGGNVITGQVDTNDAIEPKAAICLNQTDNGDDGEPATILGNTITDSHVGISIGRGTVPNVRQNSISQIPAGGTGIKLVLDSASRVSLIDNTVVTSAQHVTGLLGMGTSLPIAIQDLFVTGAAIPTLWYRGSKAVCKFSDLGSITGVYSRTTANSAFTPQSGITTPGCP